MEGEDNMALKRYSDYTTQTISLYNFHKNKDEHYYNIPRQRGSVWNIEMRSLLIQSVLINLGIPKLWVNMDSEQNLMEFLDGRQRGETFELFLDNQFCLIDSIDDIDIEGKIYKIAGKKFNELDKELQHILSVATIELNLYRDLTDRQKTEIINRLNHGKPLTVIERTRMLAPDDVFNYVQSLQEYNFFRLKLNRQSMNNNILDYIIYCIIKLETDRKNLSFDEAVIENFIKQIGKNQLLTEKVQEQINRTVIWLSGNEHQESPFATYMKFLNKYNTCIVYEVAKQAMNDGVSPLVFGGLIQMFVEDINRANKLDSKKEIKGKCDINDLKEFNRSRSFKSKERIELRISILKKYYENNIDIAEEFKLPSRNIGRGKKSN